VVLKLGGLGQVLTTPPREKPLLRNIHKAKCFLWRQNNPEVNYSPTRISRGGGGGVSRGKYRQNFLKQGIEQFETYYFYLGEGETA